MRSTRRSPISRSSRRGAVLFAVLACLLVIVLMSIALTRTMIMNHRQQRRWEQQVQATWLAESALERTAARLTIQPQYIGDRWEILASEIGGSFDGVVEVYCPASSTITARRQVEIIVHYPDHPIHRARFAKTVFIDIGQIGPELSER